MACNFRIDRQLCISTWGKEIADFTGKSSTLALGKKYYDVLPMIVADNIDAVSAVFETKDALDLKRYSFNCLFGQIKADVSIKPIITDDSITAVDVDIIPSSSCAASQALRDSRQIIDIGMTASTLAHGVRNPLNAIKGAVVYIRQKYSNEPTLIEFMKIIEDEISRLDNFISRFLGTSISEAEVAEIDINSLLSKLKVLTSFQTETSDISSNWEFGEVPLVMANAFHFEQAILNVINNAIEAMPSSGQLTVKTQVEERADRSFAVIEISDTGRGMQETRIGNPSRKDKGKGFGLSITREILKYYGGHLEIKSGRGKGTVVRLYLPAVKGAARDE